MRSSTTTSLSGSFLGRHARVLTSLGGLCLLGACSGDDTVTIIDPGPSDQQTASPGSGGESGAGSAGGGEAAGTSAGGAGSEAGSSDDGPLYVIHTTIDDPDSRTSYYITTPTLTGIVYLDATEGLELPGHRDLFAPPEGGFFVSGDFETASLTRYELGGDSYNRGNSARRAEKGCEAALRVWVPT